MIWWLRQANILDTYGTAEWLGMNKVLGVDLRRCWQLKAACEWHHVWQQAPMLNALLQRHAWLLSEGLLCYHCLRSSLLDDGKLN